MEDQYPARRRGTQAAAGALRALRQFTRAIIAAQLAAVCAIGRKSRPGDRAVAHSRGARSRVAVRHPPPVGKRRADERHIGQVDQPALPVAWLQAPAAIEVAEAPLASRVTGTCLAAQAASTGRLSGRVTTVPAAGKPAPGAECVRTTIAAPPAASAYPAFNLFALAAGLDKRSRVRRR